MASTMFGRRVGIIASVTVLSIPALGLLGGTAAYAAPGAGNAATHATHSSDGTPGTYGDPKQPQPLSPADTNAGGANNGGNCGAYCSTRDGSASANGNRTVSPAGRPCAGCVGRADNKNPKGQAPNGTDHNNGYECDGNHGIGRGNPAHTGCTSTAVTGGGTEQTSVPETPKTPETPKVPETPDTPQTPSVPAPSVAAVGGSAAGSVASVVTPAAHTPAVEVLGERVVRTVARPVPAQAQVAPAATTLPFTGAPTTLLVMLGALSLTAGLVFVVVGRRRLV